MWSWSDKLQYDRKKIKDEKCKNSAFHLGRKFGW